jgi:hypothetical protein
VVDIDDRAKARRHWLEHIAMQPFETSGKPPVPGRLALFSLDRGWANASGHSKKKTGKERTAEMEAINSDR